MLRLIWNSNLVFGFNSTQIIFSVCNETNGKTRMLSFRRMEYFGMVINQKLIIKSLNKTLMLFLPFELPNRTWTVERPSTFSSFWTFPSWLESRSNSSRNREPVCDRQLQLSQDLPLNDFPRTKMFTLKYTIV